MTPPRTLLPDGRFATITVRQPQPGEVRLEFPCFGSSCAVVVSGATSEGPALMAAARAKRRMLTWHRQFSRFDPESELSRLNADPRESVLVSVEMAGFIQTAIAAAELTDGLVDPTLLPEIVAAGYDSDLALPALALTEALKLVPSRIAACPDPRARWRGVDVDVLSGTVTRPVGVQLDSGGIAKGMFADILALELQNHESFAVDAAGDVRVGGDSDRPRSVEVISPFDFSVLHTFKLRRGAAATSGIGRRSWLDAAGNPAHHLLDPATGRPAFTGVVQVSALAPSGVHAEALAKAAVLSGPAGAAGWLSYGGVVVYDGGDIDVIEPSIELVEPWVGQ